MNFKSLTWLCLSLGIFSVQGEVIWPCEGQNVTAGGGATVAVSDGQVKVDVRAAKPNVWPAAYFNFASPRDFSQCATLNVTFTNYCDRALRISVKVKGDTVQGQLPEGGVSVPPHACRTKELRLFAETWAFDKPHGLIGLKRNPRVGGGSTFSLQKVRSVSCYLPAGTHDATFGILRAELTPGDGSGNNVTVLKADRFCPWVDEFGQARYAEYPDKVHSREEFRARIDAEAKDLAARPCGIPGSDRFGGWADGPQLAATGHFRTEKIDGKWWLVDPDGHLFFSQGVNCGWNLTPTAITFRESYFEKLPPREGPTKRFWFHHTKPAFRNFYSDPQHVPYDSFSFSQHNLWLAFGDDWRRLNAENECRRMRAWGINTTTGADGDILACTNRVPYVTSIGPSARKIEGCDGYWGKLCDFFAPEFAESCRRAAEAHRARGTNEWCLGWTSNNEQSWGPDGASLARGVLNSPDDQPAKIALVKMLAEKGKTPVTATEDDLRALGEAVVEKYYSTVRAAIKAVAPDALYLGDRNDKQNPEVFRVASRYCDVVTVNVYDYRPDRVLPPGSEDKPFLVTEFHFGCYDTGYFYASLIPVKDQKTRAQCYRDYLRATVDNPNYIGAHWFCWRDCPITGVVGECANAQCGLVAMTDVPYTELINAVRDVAREMYPRRAGRIVVTERGIRNDGETCQSAALAQLVKDVPDGTTLVFPAGSYFIAKAVPLVGKKNLTFRGEKGATLKLHFSPWGAVSESNNGFNAQNCDGLTFENFTVTTDHPSSCAGRIVALDPANGTYDVKIDPEFPITGWEHFWGTDTCDDDGMPDYAIETYENVTKAEVPDGKGGTRVKYTGTKYEVIGPQLIRVVPPKGKNFDFRRIHVGHRVLYRYIIYGSTVFSFSGCRDTVLRDIEIERCASMGAVVSPPSRNITFERFNMRVPKNSAALYCANADGIHILGLTGFLKMKDCHFLGLGDDALNIHGKAGEVKSFDPATGEAMLICRNTKRQETRLPHAWAAAGEKLVVYDGRTFLTKGLVDVVRYDGDGRARLAAGAVDVKTGDVLANDKDFASVELSGCSVKNTRARGFLLQSRNMVVENCSFTGLSLPGLLISPDIRVWNEVGPTVNTEVRNCTFEKCGMNGSPANLGALTVKTSHDVHPGTDPAGVHRDIRVIGCRFTGCGNSGIFISSTDGVQVKGNTFSRCSICRFDKKNPNTLYDIWLNNCANVSLDGNTTDKDAKYLSQVTEQTN